MPRKADFIFDVRIRISEGLTLDSIVRNPRKFKPKDLLDACNNNDIALKSGNPPQAVVTLASYIMKDFFAICHATGLYNRQMTLWQALSTVNSIHVYQQTSGVFQKSALPVYDLAFCDYKEKPILYCGLTTEIPEKQKALALLKSFIGRAGHLSQLSGALACFPTPFPVDVLDFAIKQTYTHDHIGRYESVLKTLNCSFDLLQMDTANLNNLSAEGDNEPDLRSVFTLVHPNLKRDPQSPAGKAPSTPVVV